MDFLVDGLQEAVRLIASGDQPGASNDGPDADGEDAEEQSLDFDGFQ